LRQSRAGGVKAASALLREHRARFGARLGLDAAEHDGSIDAAEREAASALMLSPMLMLSLMLMLPLMLSPLLMPMPMLMLMLTPMPTLSTDRAACN